MQQRGFNYQRPEQAWNSPNWSSRPPGSKPTEDEIKTAVADMECKDAVGYISTRKHSQEIYENKLIKQHSAELDVLQQNRGRQFTAAKSTLRTQ